MDSGFRALCFAIVLIGIAVLYDFYRPHHDENLIIEISSSWKKHIMKPSKGPSGIVIG